MSLVVEFSSARVLEAPFGDTPQTAEWVCEFGAYEEDWVRGKIVVNCQHIVTKTVRMDECVAKVKKPCEYREGC